MQELPPLLNFLRANGHSVELIIVNDGSPNVDELTKFCTEHSFRLIHHERNLGKGAAVRTGMLNATSAVRIFTDADIPFQYETLEAMLKEFANEPVDGVVGDRRQSHYFAQTPMLRRLGSMVFSLLVDLIMLKRMGDTQCGIKGFRSNCMEPVFASSKLNGFAADIEWLHLARKKRLTIRSVSAEFRNAGQSSVVFWKHAVLMLRDVLKIRFS